MTSDTHVDGNAIGGVLIEVFGREMTDALGRCAGCGAVNAVGSMVVYRGGPGDVVRCPNCETVLVVVTRVTDRPRMHFSGLRWLQPSS